MQYTSVDVHAEKRSIHEREGKPDNLSVNSSLDLDSAPVGECARRSDEDPLLDPSVIRQPGLATAEVPVDFGSTHATLAEKYKTVRS